MRPSNCSVALLAAVGILGLLASPAGAREAYVADSADDTVTVFETATGAPITAIPVGTEPSDVAIDATGSRAYVTNHGSDTLSVIDVATRQVLGSPIEVGEGPRGIAISPAGPRAYVANFDSDTVSVIDTQSNTVITTIPLAAEAEPEGIAITPDGASVFVAQRDNDVALITTATNSVAGAIKTTAGVGPSRLALTRDGQRAFVSNANSSSASVLNLVTGTVLGSPVLVGPIPTGVAVNANGTRAYVASRGASTVVAIDTVSHLSVGSPIPGFDTPAQIVVAPGGARAYVTDEGGSTVSILDTLTSVVTGQVAVGNAPQGIAIVPTQGPTASFTISPAERKAGQPVSLDASASRDPDGRPALYAWDFGDGEGEVTTGPVVEHVYAKAGFYTATLTVTDDESCSTDLLFTGQTATCNGNPAARTGIDLEAIDVTPPDFALAGRRRQPLSHRVVVVGRCPYERCRATARGSLAAVQRTPSRKVRAKHETRPASTLLANGVERKLRLRLPGAAFRAARAALASGGQAIVKVTAHARDAAGNKRRRVLKISLFEPRRKGGKR